MGTYRMYTGTDGKARWEPIDLAKTPDWLSGLDVSTLKFGIRQPGVVQDWHPAPQRQDNACEDDHRGHVESVKQEPRQNRSNLERCDRKPE